jgi:ABC-type branched-subunit amino acid transport system ATPase component
MRLLEVDGLTKRFGGLTAVDRVGFKVEQGELRGLIGPNGSGKSTVFHLLTGVHRPDGGEVRFQGSELTGRPPYEVARSGIGRTFQEIQLFYDMTVLQNAMVGCERLTRAGALGAMLRPRRVRDEERFIREKARECLAFVGLTPYEGEFARNISYGHQRLLEIARALAGDPALLLLDEPAAGMNQSETAQLVTYIRRIRERGVTIVLVEHNMKMVMGLCSKITVLARGKVIAEAGPAEVQNDDAVIEAYLGKPRAHARAD